MSKISKTLLAQVAAVVTPICTKSEKQNHTVDQLYHHTVNLIVDAAISLKDYDHSKWKKLRKNMLIGEKACVMDALKDLQAIALKRREVCFKYPLSDKSKSAAEKKLTSEDLDIIEQFIKRLPEAYAYEQSKEE